MSALVFYDPDFAADVAERRLLPALCDFDELVASFAAALGVSDNTVLTWIIRPWLDLTEANLAKARSLDPRLVGGKLLTQDELRGLFADD